MRYWVMVVVCVMVIAMAMAMGPRPVLAEAGDSLAACREDVWFTAQKLQPWFGRAVDPVIATKRMEHLKKLTDAICAASVESGQEPLLALSIAFAESSLNPAVGLGLKNGKRGEKGYFQVLPGSPALGYAPRKCSQHEPDCNATSALRYMKHLQEAPTDEGGCASEDPWVWIAAYKSGDCLSPARARERDGVRATRAIFCSVYPECEEVWNE